MLATHHWIREVHPDVFANNRLSSLIDTGKTPQLLRDAYVMAIYIPPILMTQVLGNCSQAVQEV